MKDRVKIILVQLPKDEVATRPEYRIAKLVGAVRVYANDSKGLGEHHVGDVISERIADSLAQNPSYEVTVTQQQKAA